MNSRFAKIVAVLLLIAVSLCGSGFADACGEGDPCDCADESSSQHCAANCGCHSLGLPGGVVFFDTDDASQQFAAATMLKLPLVPASILMPPKH